jgi:tetratricopeptide (TPR) repeat protein
MEGPRNDSALSQNPDEFEKQLKDLGEAFCSKVAAFREETTHNVEVMFREDIRALDLPALPGVPDDDVFMMRANQAALALFDNQFYAASERLYRSMIEATQTYDHDHDAKHHLGALYASVALACIAQGNFDQGIVELLKAAQDDVETRSIPRRDSYAITGLLEEQLDRFRQEALRAAQRIDPALTMTNLAELRSVLGDLREYAFLAYVRLALLHKEANQQFQNEFSQLQMFNALRGLSSLFEVELKIINGNMEGKLLPVITSLYKSKTWWKDFFNGLSAVKGRSKPFRPIDDQIRDSVALKPTDADSRFWKSLIVIYIVRNYTIHQLETYCALIQDHYEEVFQNIMYAMITARYNT